MNEKFWYLKRCPLVEQLPAERLAQLEAVCRYREFARKSLVYLPSDQADAALLLVEGRVKLGTTTPDGTEAVLAYIERGELFGELAVIDEGRRDEWAMAVAKSRIVLIPARELKQLAAEFPVVSLALSRLLGLRRKRVERRLKSLLFRTSRERLQSLLDELADRYGRATSEGLVVEHRLSHQDLASLIGVTRETVTLLLNEMQREERLVVRRRSLVLARCALNGAPPARQAAVNCELAHSTIASE